MINEPHASPCKKTGLHVTQSYQLPRTHFGQYQASLPMLKWLRNWDCYISHMHKMHGCMWCGTSSIWYRHALEGIQDTDLSYCIVKSVSIFLTVWYNKLTHNCFHLLGVQGRSDSSSPYTTGSKLFVCEYHPISCRSRADEEFLDARTADRSLWAGT